jgi:hypothetical protein
MSTRPQREPSAFTYVVKLHSLALSVLFFPIFIFLQYKDEEWRLVFHVDEKKIANHLEKLRRHKKVKDNLKVKWKKK